LRSASASSTVSTDALPDPPRAPPLVVAPGRMTTRLVPRLAICDATAWLAPCPTATIAMSAATPMKTPSMVRIDRSRLRASACAAVPRIIRPNDNDAAPAGA
jgi:hypothetical protein